MATRTVVCPECDVPLSPGRFACSSCGALVAAVATVSRPFTQPESSVQSILAPVAPDEAAAPAARPMVAAVADVEAPTPPRKAKSAGPGRRSKLAPLVAKLEADDAADQPEPKQPLEAQRPEETMQPPVSWVLAQPAPARPASPSAPAVSPAAVSAAPEPTWPASLPPAPPASPPSEPSWPEHPTWPPQRTIDAIAAPVDESPPRVPAGAYLPPSAVLPPAESLPLPGTKPAEPPEDTNAPGRDGSLLGNLRLRLGEGAGPLGLPADGPTQVVVLGAGVAGLGFLLPWADIVLGTSSMGSYLDQWGLAGPGHVLVLALVAGLAGLALLAERLPRWVRLGMPSIALAFLLAGLVWPYLVGPYNASIGVYVVAVGALVMIAGGLLDRIATRHAVSEASV